MCFKYHCIDCKQNKYSSCKDYDEDTRKCGDGTEPVPTIRIPQKCGTCVTIRGAIRGLRVLLFREPWLATEGLAGAPKKESWEMGVDEKHDWDHDYQSGGEDEDGYTQEKRKAIREEAERAVAARWDAMKKEQEENSQ
ncbi:hypothetical protein LTR84_006162 [Exophiala bonariae]|uniref:Uncharacterized protein n=1 Tax=Exophiala bonariae TaxID=1690606 RepID=A0AAV9N1Z1_9EURO|nr:hypothetical protein LTR84_006162 [Exophiala bonariae]